MRNWDPLAILKYLTGIIPQHACIFIFLLDKRIWEDASLNPNFPNQDVMEEKKGVAQFMFMAHLTVFFMQFFYETGLGLCLLQCFTCCLPCWRKDPKVEEAANMEALIERTEEEQ